MEKPLIKRGIGGEYSTISLGNGMVETMWFPDDPNVQPSLVGRSVERTLKGYQAEHISNYEAGNK